MSKVIIINKSIKFEPDKKQLSTESSSVNLNTPASYCLELLLNNQGELVTHEQLYQFAWGRFGMEATANTLYQNISVLRKSLQECGILDNIIRTMARRGFILSASVEHIDDDVEKNEAKPSILYEAPSQIKPTQIQQEVRSKPLLTINRDFIFIKNKIIRNRSLLISLSVTLLTLISFWVYFIFGDAFNYIPYKFFMQKGNCYYYVNKSGKDDGKLNDIINSLHQQCSEKRYLYLTRYNQNDVMSVFNCRKPFRYFGTNNCISYYYAR